MTPRDAFLLLLLYSLYVREMDTNGNGQLDLSVRDLFHFNKLENRHRHCVFKGVHQSDGQMRHGTEFLPSIGPLPFH